MNEASGNQGTTTRPYLLRALHDWCTDNGFTPYIAVQVGPRVQVPLEYVKGNEIVLNIGFEATSGLKLGNEFIEFRARFGGSAREIMVPVDHVLAIYARENGQGMAFPAPGDTAATAVTGPGARGQDTQAADTAADTPTKGLRLAKNPPTPDVRPVAEAPVAPVSKGDDDPPPPPKGGRPALKRVK